MAGASYQSPDVWGRRENDAMAVTARKYNPGFLTDDELVASFCVRTAEFETMVEVLRECTGASNPHQIVIGPRGSGKTSLLLRVAAEVRRDPELAAGFFPVVFAEESYEVSTAGEFWLECLAQLAAQAPHQADEPDLQSTLEELRATRDDRELADRCLGALLDHSDREGKRLALMVENLDMMFRDMADADAGWRLRKVLQTEPRIVLLASATSRFDEIDNPKHALYDLFSVRTLRPLDTSECTTLWEAVAGQCPPPGTIRSLQILTGGSPRLLAIVARFGAELSFHKLMGNLLDLIDDHTEYFKSHLEALPAQERRVYLALAALWKPATTREIADHARLDTSKCSAQLTRLVERGAVRTAGGSARRKQYYLTERLYNIYYLLRRSRRSDRLVEALIRFMESRYTPSEFKGIGALIIREAEFVSGEIQSLLHAALARLIELPSLAEYREELLAMIPEGFAMLQVQGTASADMPGLIASTVEPHKSATRSLREGTDKHEEHVARKLLDTASALDDENHSDHALVAYDKLGHRFAYSNNPGVLEYLGIALFRKALMLERLDRVGDSIATYDALVRRFGNLGTAAQAKWIGAALIMKGLTLDTINCTADALATYDEVVHRYRDSEVPALLKWVGTALVMKGLVLQRLDRMDDSLDAFDEVVHRLEEDESPVLVEQIAKALGAKSLVLQRLGRTDDALNTCDEVVRRIENHETPILVKHVAEALIGKGNILSKINQPNDAIAAYDEVLQRFGDSETPLPIEQIAEALVGKGNLLRKLNRPQEALDAYDEAVRRMGEDEKPAIVQQLATTLVSKGFMLQQLNRMAEALDTCSEVVCRFGEARTPTYAQQVAMALTLKGFVLHVLGRAPEALAAYDDVVRRFGEDRTPTIIQQVANAISGKGSLLTELSRPQDALAAFDEMVRRFGKDETPTLVHQVARARVMKGLMLERLELPNEALVAFDEVIRRFGEGEDPLLLRQVAFALVSKGLVLRSLNRTGDALHTYGELIRRFGKNESLEIRGWVEDALLGVAAIELKSERYGAAAKKAGRILERCQPVSPEKRVQAHLVRAKAAFADDDQSACARDVEATLALLPDLGSLPKAVLDALTFFSAALGAERMCELIKGSPSADLLLPLTTALELELGLEPRVAQEVKEVAEDIRRDLATMREATTDGSGEAKVVSVTDTGSGAGRTDA